MIVVSDSSVLINLAWINQLELLPQLYSEQEKMLPEIKSSLDSLRQQAGFYISEPLYRRVLRDADE